MNKKGAWAFWVSISLIVLLLIVSFLYFALYNPNNSMAYTGEVIRSSSLGSSSSQALSNVDGNSVLYLLSSMRAYNLHNPPLSSDYPKIEIDVSGQIFSASVKKGVISLDNNPFLKKDLILRTTKEEVLAMINDRDYIKNSFNSGKSRIELVASKFTLFAKGYLGLYNEIVGKSVTGNVIRVATD